MQQYQGAEGSGTHAEHSCWAHNPGKFRSGKIRLCSVCSEIVHMLQTHHDSDFSPKALVAAGCCASGLDAAQSMVGLLEDPATRDAAAQRILAATRRPGALIASSSVAQTIARSCPSAPADSSAQPTCVLAEVRALPGCGAAAPATDLVESAQQALHCAREAGDPTCSVASVVAPAVGKVLRGDERAAPAASQGAAVARAQPWRCDMCGVVVHAADAASARCWRCAERIAAGRRHGLPQGEAEWRWRAWSARGEPAPWLMYDAAHLWALADVLPVWSWGGMSQVQRRASIAAHRDALQQATQAPARPRNWSVLQWYTAVEVGAALG